MVAARLTAANRFPSSLVCASTRRILQLWQIACAISTSSEISCAQPLLKAGSGEAAPFWLTLQKQPLAVVQAGRPNVELNVARSDSMFGASNASTMAIVCPAGPVFGRL